MDGATVDREGGYWSAVMMAGRIRRFLPDGTPDLEVQVPFTYPSMIAFGGPDLDTLYITTGNMQHGTGERDALKSGGVFSFKPGFKGLPQPLVKRI
jgi:sugar lactone lactonase YvrE